MLSLKPGKVRVKQFNISSKKDTADFEKVMNDPKCRVKEKKVNTNMYGENIVYLEYYDMKRESDD